MQYLLYTLILLIVLNLYFRVANHFNIIDKPNTRSSHKSVVLRGGGIIFPLGITLWFIFIGFEYPWFFSGLMLISFVSFLDDLWHVAFWIRLLIHITAIFLLLIQLESTPWPWWLWALTLFTATGIINAFNFMDGINGITAGYSISALTGLWIVNNYQVSFVQNDLLYAAGLAVALFGFFNFRLRARCFAGDVGAVSISFILVFLLVKLILSSGNLIYMMFLIVYGIDTSLTIVFRLRRHENIFEAHRRHLYQLMTNESGISHIKVSSGYAIVQLMINLVIIASINRLSYIWTMFISSGIIIILSIFYMLAKRKLGVDFVIRKS